MDNLPIPNMRSSWVAALVNTIFMFLFYYLCLFGPLLKEYRDHFDHNRSFDKSKEQLAVWVDVPRYFYAAGPATVHVHVKNESKKPFNDVKIYLITRADPEAPTLLIPNVFNNDVYSSLVEFPIIEPLSTANGRVSFITQANTSITSVLLKVGDNESQQLFAEAEIPFVESGPKALQIDFLEHVLLPPWSNGFILALILLSTFLIRTDKEEKEEEKIFDSENQYLPTHVWRKEFINDYIRSSAIFILMILITFIIYMLLGSSDAVFPFVGIVLFSWLVIKRVRQKSGTQSKFLSPTIIFLGFISAVLAVFLVFFNPRIFISPLGKILWILLGIGGLVVFIWYYGRQLASETALQMSDVNNNNETEHIQNSNEPKNTKGHSKNTPKR